MFASNLVCTKKYFIRSSTFVEMARKKKSKPVEANAAAVDSKPHKCNFKNCRKKYTTISALNNHKRIKHNDIRWKCPLCDEEQVSKDKHSLHIYRNHRSQWQSNMNLDQNQVRKNKMTQKAKDAKLFDQQKTIDNQMDKILRLKTILITARSKLRETRIKLKAANQKLVELGYEITEEGDEIEDDEPEEED